MTITIFGGYKSWTRDCRARWLLEEAGQAYDLIQVDVFAGEQRKPAYLAVNPLGKVPFLRDDQVAIFESGAILEHLAETYAPKLVPPTGAAERAAYLQWLFYTAATLEPMIVQIFANRVLFPDSDGAEARVLQGINQLSLHARVLSEHLEGRNFMVGERFTAADIMLGTALVWADKAGALADYPEVSRYLRRLAERPAFKTAFAPTTKEFDGYPGASSLALHRSMTCRPIL